jgi:hypothetical protein
VCGADGTVHGSAAGLVKWAMVQLLSDCREQCLKQHLQDYGAERGGGSRTKLEGGGGCRACLALRSLFHVRAGMGSLRLAQGAGEAQATSYRK